ncbi:MAG: glycosyltransferase family 2 protein [Candidatus Omnitrophica bacterium]|nr:glycosyltransferase family 2 protein [Candidatus Omnitrophota bacterium]
MSVIIPVFNRRELLPRAILSVIQQRPAPLEILIADDASTDGSCETLERDFPGVRVLRLESNQGPAAARNHALAQAKGRWIAFLDSDDAWMPGKLRAQLDFLRAHPEYRILQTEELWIRNGKRVNPMKKHQKHGGWIYERCLPLCLISPSAVMIERSLLEEVGPFDESYPACEDYELWLRIASRHPVGLVPKPYVFKYGGHSDQRSREFPAMDRFRIRAMAKILSLGILSESQSRATVSELAQKSEIYFRGAEKHGSLEESRELRELVTPALSARPQESL